MQKLTVGLVGAHMAGFLAEERGVWPHSVAALQELSEAWGFNLIAIDQMLTSGEEAERVCKELKAQNVDFTLIQSSSCALGDIMTGLAHLPGRLGLWALSEPNYEGVISLNSLTGCYMYAGILRTFLAKEKLRFKWFYGQPESQAFQKRLLITLQALEVLKGLRTAKIGVVGGISPGFYNVYHDAQAINQGLGTQIVECELEEVFARAKACDADQARETVKAMRAAATAIEVSSQWMDRTARVYLALHDLAVEGGWTALAIRCWPEFAEEMEGLGPCAALGWLNETGLVAACEGDALAALSMLALSYAAREPVTVMDLAAIFEDEGLVQMFHCGPSPNSLADERGTRLTYQPLLDTEYLVETPHAGVISDLVLAPGPATMIVLSKRADEMLLISADIVEGPTSGYIGSRAWLGNLRISGQPYTVWDLMETLMYHGLEHHFPLARGDFTDVFMELAAWAGIKVLQGLSYRDHLQSPV